MLIHCRAFFTAGALLLAMLASVRGGTLAFDFNLPAETTTSAGVYGKDGKLVRTIWRRVRYLAGRHQAIWDGKTDDGKDAPDEPCTVRILCNDVHYIWEGVIGNTSASFNGDSIWHSGTNKIESLAISGGDAFTALGFNEGGGQIRRFATASPQTASAVKGHTLEADFKLVAADAERIYTANTGTSGWNVNNRAFITAYRISDGAPCSFPAAAGKTNSTIVFDPKWEHPEHPDNTFAGCIDVWEKTGGEYDEAFVQRHAATGLAVQTTGDLLAVAHGPLNQVLLFDKRSGAARGELPVENPGSLTFTKNGSLWVISGAVLQEFTDPGGEMKIASSITTLKNPIAVAASPLDDALLLIADAGTQQFIFYDAKNEQVRKTLGLAGGYSASNGPDVSHDKFAVGTPLAFQPDGSFWVYDQALSRLLHFSAEATYLEQIMYHLNSAVAVDSGDPTRLFAGFLEYRIDYRQPLLPGDPNAPGGNGAWKIVRNWAAGLHGQFAASGLNTVATFGGRTFAFVQDEQHPQAGNALVELPASGSLRDTGLRFPNSYNSEGGLSYSLFGNGDLRYAAVTEDGQPTGRQKVFEQTFSRIGADGNPIWRPAVEIASMPARARDPANGRTSPGLYAPWQLPATDSGVVAVMSAAAKGGFALGGVKVRAGATDWLWQASPCIWNDIPMDGLGSFEVGDGERTLSYPSSKLMSWGRNLIYGYNGEFWNDSQANQFMHFYDDGLFVGQFGPSGDMLGVDGVSMPGKAGNNSSPNLVRNGSELFLYGNDESAHGGVQRWRLPGVAAIYELEGKGVPGSGNEAIATVRSVLPKAPFALTATPGDGRVRLDWQPAAGAASYRVRTSDNPAGPFKVAVADLRESQCTVSALPNGKNVWLDVVALDRAGSELGASEQVLAHPFDPNIRVHALGEAAFATNRASYRFDVSTDALTKGAFPLTLHTMFQLPGAPNGSLLRTDLGSEGFVIFRFATAGHADAGHLPASSGIAIRASGGWSPNDLYADSKFQIDGAEGGSSSLRADGKSGASGGTVRITVKDPSRWHVVTVFLPDTFSQPRHYVLSALSLAEPAQVARREIDESLHYQPHHGQAGIRGMNRLHQFYFRGDLELRLEALPNADPEADNANLQALFFDAQPVF